ncbi:MAG: Glyoxalase/Bleomycin resistance protein/Dioxygenase family protein [Planctomycetaceae bacterium]|nr:Glyoxalase/Bleomycin resistance protein/Dioxygenase family protein [Planctomycetaceae bacterium]
MNRVTGIGGIFIKSKDPAALGNWYKTHLGIDVQEWGGASFKWKSETNPQGVGTTVWSTFQASSDYFSPSTAGFMVNYRVEDLRALLAVLREEGCHVVGNIEESDFGKFGWVMDPDGNKIELWQPPEGQ